LTSGNICSSSALSNGGGACETEEACGGTEGVTDFCIPNKFPKDLQVSLSDQFEDKGFDVKKPVSLCTPADKNAEGIHDPLTHLKGYQIKEVARSCRADAPSNANRACASEEGCGGATGSTAFCQATPEHIAQTSLKVRNQFHPAGSELVVDTLKPDRLLVPTAKGLVHPVGPPESSAHDVDHYKCYTVEVTPGTPVFTAILGVSVGDQLIDPPKFFNLERPTRLCTPVDKNGEGIKSAAAHLMCYQAKAAGGQPEHVKVLGIHVNNQFGPERLDTVREDELCVPSEKNPLTCNAGFADCNGNAADGCEVNVASDPNHCGACGTACSGANGTPSCTAGACQIACHPGFADCNGNPTDGCETNVSNNPMHCGACGTVCSDVSGTPSCTAGACQIACDAGFADCNGNAADGCETDVFGDENNCGACGTVCSSVNGTPSCAAGACQIPCNPGFDDCNGNTADGCEVNVSSDPNHCGACGTVCSSVNGAPSCAAGACQIACHIGFGDCNGNAADGCETDVSGDENNCGACGHVCAGAETCQSGVCVGAPTCGPAVCSGVPTDTCTDADNCGGCGVICILGCSAGRCTVS
jgi:hypothetical protein